MSWSAPTDPGRTFRLQHRPVGNPTWQTVESLTTTGYSLTGLTPNIPYEWQVQSVCSPTESTSFATGRVFTPLCPIPLQPSGNPTATGASFSWQINPAETINTFGLQYRQTGAADWTTINSLTPTSSYGSYRSYALTGLSRNTGYEWRVLSNCALGTQSDYTAIRSFTTVCAPAYSAYTAELSASSTLLVWSVNADADTRFEIRWRPTGTPDWTTISNLTITQSQGSYLLTGLTTNTPYEWQVRTVCSPTESSSFAPGGQFTPRCPAPFANSWQSGIKVTSATINWNQTHFVAQYEVYYRPIGSANWLIVSNITTTSAVLTNLQSVTPYEWQVRTLCGSGIVSDFSEVRSFTTLSCIIPVLGYSPSQVSDVLAILPWYSFTADADTRFEIRWRATAAPDWTTVSNLTTNVGNGLYSLTGLTPNTSYEWQIRARCSPTLETGFSASITFQTLSPCNGVLYTLRPGYWLDPSTWSCNRVPLPTDVVQIRHNVLFYPNQVSNALRVQFEPGGKIYYSVNSRLRLGL